MAVRGVPSDIRVPTVTPADLQDFHDRHFGPTTRSVVPDQDGKKNWGEDEQRQEEEVDDLGYYPDGVKRTLTDEQIAMFRHSEISRLLRQRQLRRENGMFDEESSDPSAALGSYSGSSPLRVQNNVNEGSGLIASGETEGTPMSSTKKRKMDHEGWKKGRDTAPTSRRRARELDDVAGSVDVLDYGEESYAQADEKATAGRTQVSYAELDEVENPTAIQEPSPPRTEGRKIWWPTLG
ncbi:MAG: hypothetical protein Q9202_007482 [Teloschistes flavicans]